ncbi:chromosomal replication initiator protein DnaA [Thiothrix eikelboomii]|uniref:Chromosomal replication initiator protein DnaA n=1 Tax=Thiothrix eikelboomii TaxID=92487 RepID=A0A1T4XHD1_9GAMM|nr:chromosomal replication initiator protein DnaA [Thiothrix eikelboomii]SKA88511.1 chromosomal replication initiator protein DnaA [Thiothrix eikelboomii]
MLWQQCLTQLEHEFPSQEINTWLRSLHAVEKPKALYLLAPNPIVLQHIHEIFLPHILRHVRNLSGDHSFDVMLQIGSRSAPKPLPKPPVTAVSAHPSPVAPPTSTAAVVNHPLNSADLNLLTPAAASERFVNALNIKMTFENFVEGKSNQLARAAALQVGEHPGSSYNPLFLYGGVGLGKTHLMHAIGNCILKANPEAHVLYVYAERFVNDMVNALRTSRIEEFKQHYRSVDALLIDDIQFFANKDRSMEEFFHTFNALLEGQKQIILTSDRYPRDVEGLDDRLRSRFNWGLTMQIEPPDLETRVAILRKKAEDHELYLPKDIAFFIAKHFRSNIRDLEGALQRVIASMRLRCIQDINMDFVHDVLRDQLASQDKMVSISNIKKTVAKYYNVRITEMDSKRRTRSVARPRQVAMALAKELTSHSLPEIGTEFGGRDHTTVLHACRKIVELRESDPRMEEDYRILIRSLTS